MIKKKRGQKPYSRWSKKAKTILQEIPKNIEEENVQSQTQNIQLPKLKESLSLSSWGLIIVNKIHKPLQATLESYNDQITPLREILKKLLEYPNPRE